MRENLFLAGVVLVAIALGIALEIARLVKRSRARAAALEAIRHASQGPAFHDRALPELAAPRPPDIAPRAPWDRDPVRDPPRPWPEETGKAAKRAPKRKPAKPDKGEK